MYIESLSGRRAAAVERCKHHFLITESMKRSDIIAICDAGL